MTHRFIDLPNLGDERGRLMFAEAERHIPFVIRRVYALYGVHPEAARGAHAHRKLEQCFFALSGSFRIHLDDRRRQDSFILDNPARALYVGPMTWRNLTDFTPGAACLVLASEYFDEQDYIRNFDRFREEVGR
jgi:dTDP-4-dehydrorhamnose 3,5-epimerase-like enzyme